jgi:P-type E1-E2 ATPase
MGGATVVCTDKTGTLTKNMMFVNKTFCCEKVLKAEQKAGENVKIGEQSVFNLLMQSALWNTHARIEKYGHSNYDINGSATDIGMFRYFMDVTSKEICYLFHRE